jgi:hypothetical protein
MDPTDLMTALRATVATDYNRLLNKNDLPAQNQRNGERLRSCFLP